MADPDWMSVCQAADRIGVCRQRVGFLIREGRLPATRLGKNGWIIHRAHVIAMKEELEADPRSAPVRAGMRKRQRITSAESPEVRTS